MLNSSNCRFLSILSTALGPPTVVVVAPATVIDTTDDDDDDADDREGDFGVIVGDRSATYTTSEVKSQKQYFNQEFKFY